jgi:transcriptional regulator with GAF, ATPase, and Fis domain
LERSAIVEAMARADGVQKDAALLLGISPRVIHYKLRKYGLGK